MSSRKGLSLPSEEDAEVVDFHSDAVRLQRMEVGPDLCGDLCSVLIDNSTVHTLDLEHNAIGDKGAEHVARLVSQNPAIVAVNVGHNGITDVGAVALCRAFRKQLTVQSINLGGNPIGDTSLSELSRIVRVSETLQELVVLDTAVSVHGALTLAEAMVENTSLNFVSLPYTLGYTVLDQVQKLLARNYARRNKLDERLLWSAQAGAAQQAHQARVKRLWAPKQTLAEPTAARTRTGAARLSDWADPTQAAALVCLSVLEKRHPEATRESRRFESQQTTPRGRGIGGGTRVNPEDICLSRAVPSESSSSARSSIRGGATRSSRSGALPSIPTSAARREVFSTTTTATTLRRL